MFQKGVHIAGREAFFIGDAHIGNGQFLDDDGVRKYGSHIQLKNQLAHAQHIFRVESLRISNGQIPENHFAAERRGLHRPQMRIHAQQRRREGIVGILNDRPHEKDAPRNEENQNDERGKQDFFEFFHNIDILLLKSRNATALRLPPIPNWHTQETYP